MLALTLALALSGGALGVGAARAESEPVAGSSERKPARSGEVFPTIEAAALDALARAHRDAGTRDRGHLRIGTIYRVLDGYRYRSPIRSLGTVWSGRSPILRFQFQPGDVASYVIHPASGRKRLDRMNEAPNRHQRRLVEQADPLKRPLYLLTPSRRVLRYSEQGLSRVASLPGAMGKEEQVRAVLAESVRSRELSARR